MTTMRIALAQFAPVLGDVAANLERVVDLGEQAAEQGSAVVAFPELALTGYALGERVQQAALRLDDPRWLPIKELSRRLAVLIGFVLDEKDALFNAAALLHQGEFRLVHRKVYLPTYGAFEEGKWFWPGNRWECTDLWGWRVGVLICEESWHLSPAYSLFLQQVDVLFILTNSCNFERPLDDESGSAMACRVQNRFFARMLTSYVMFVNRVGDEAGRRYWGGSEAIAPDGRLLQRAPEFEQGIIVVDIDATRLRATRLQTPLRRDERPELLYRHLKRWFDAG